MSGAADAPVTVRVELPPHLERLAKISGPVSLNVGREATLAAVMDALEATYPVLRGTVRQHGSPHRRAMIRFFACGRDLSLEPPQAPLPQEVASGQEVLRVVGAIAGG